MLPTVVAEPILESASMVLLSWAVLRLVSLLQAAILDAYLDFFLLTGSLLQPNGLEPLLDHSSAVQELSESLILGSFVGIHLHGLLFLLFGGLFSKSLTAGLLVSHYI